MKKILYTLLICAVSLTSCNESGKIEPKETKVTLSDKDFQLIGKYKVGENILYVCAYVKDTIFIVERNSITNISMSVK